MYYTHRVRGSHFKSFEEAVEESKLTTRKRESRRVILYEVQKRILRFTLFFRCIHPLDIFL